MADTSDVDTGLLAVLSGDAALMGTMPGGVAWDVAMPGVTKFVLVSQVVEEDAYVLGPGIGTEALVYLVKAVSKGTSGTEVRTAAARIHALLQDRPFPVTGYRIIAVHRQERVRYTEVDETTDERWQHRGGHYAVQACPLPL